MNHYDVVVIGGGTIGLSAAYYCASRGCKTLLIEKSKIGENHGASAGESRMFRVMYSDIQLAKLSESSFSLWKQVESESKTKILYENELLFMGSKERGETPEGDFANIENTMAKLGVPHHVYSHSQIETKYSQFKNIPKSYYGVVQKNSATIDVKSSFGAFKKIAQLKGVEFIENTTAKFKKDRHSKKYIVDLNTNQSISCNRLILAVSAWTNDLLKNFSIQFLFKYWYLTIAHFKLESTTSKIPMWYEFGAAEKNHNGLFYGFPDFKNRGEIKVSADHSCFVSDHFKKLPLENYEHQLEIISKFVANRFKDIDPRPSRLSTGFYSMSADTKMILDNLTDFGLENVSIFTGESGRGFKYTPLFGRILAELSLDGETNYDISNLRIGTRNLFI